MKLIETFYEQYCYNELENKHLQYFEDMISQVKHGMRKNIGVKIVEFLEARPDEDYTVKVEWRDKKKGVLDFIVLVATIGESDDPG